MSSKNGQKGCRGSNAQSNATGDSRKSSNVNLPGSSSALQHEADSRHDGSEPILSDLDPVNFAQLQQAGLAFLDNSAAGREWLLSFRCFQNGTDVSLRFVSDASTDDNDSPTSLLPLLTQLVPPWYRLASVERRKADKEERAHPFLDYDWLLQYVADYMNLPHGSLDEEEVRQLLSAILEMDQLTTSASDIELTVTIVNRLLLHHTFPNALIEKVVDILAASVIILSTSPSVTISETLDKFLSGDMRDPVLEKLFEFAITPTYQNNSQKMVQGRGSLRLLASVIDFTDQEGNLVMKTRRFIDALDVASTSCIFRYCTEVLDAFHVIFQSDQAGKVLHDDFDHMLEAINHCIQTVLPRTATSRSPLSMQSPDRDQVLSSAQKDAKYLAERNQSLRRLLADFEQFWPQVAENQQERIRELFMEHAKDLTDAQAALVIKSLEPLAPGTTDVTYISSKINSIFDAFIRNNKTSVENRVQASDYCLKVARDLVMNDDQSPSQTSSPALAAGKHIVDRILNILNNEYDLAVVQGMMRSLGDIAFATVDASKYPYADLIVKKLLWLVKNERNEDADAEQGILYTCAIREMFLRGLVSAAPVVPKAFDALIEIADTGIRSRMCRLAALRLLVRIRCDAHGMLYLQSEPDSEYIAAALCRTEESRASFAGDSYAAPRLSASSAHATYFGSPQQLWLYPEETAVVSDWPTIPSTIVGVKGHMQEISADQAEIRLFDWLVAAIRLFQTDTEWETLSFMLVHFGAQLSNTTLFTTSLESIVKLRQVLCDQVINGNFREPPSSTGLKKSDAALCMFNVLTGLIPYATLRSELIQKGFGDDLVKAFLSGTGGTWDGTSRGCIHALCVCSFEVPASVASQYPNIVTKMSKCMTQSHLTIHILEFLAQVARLPEVHSNFNQDEITMIFGICLQFLEKAREHQLSTTGAPSPRSGTPARHSGLSLRRPPYRAAMLQDLSLPQYASALAYHTMIFWFLSLKLEVRAFYVSWIVSRLIWKNSNGEDTIDEQSQVFIDFMQRTAYSDLGETKPDPDFAQDHDGTISSASWIVGLSIVTAESAGHTGRTQITKRQAAGTTHAIYQQLTAPLPDHHVPSHTEIRVEDSRYGATSMLPPHILLQMVTTAAPTSIADQPLPLPREDYVTRALAVFDRVPTVDSHKLGVIYVDQGQNKDVDYLANTGTSSDFDQFLRGLGYVVNLQPPLAFNPQGLQYPRDGPSTIAWRDRVTEIIYHVPTMMPNDLENDPSCNTKKSHVGNCHVVIIFNESGLPWKMDNFPSAVTFVHVVITPATRSSNQEEANNTPQAPCEFFNVTVITKGDHSNVTPASDPKVISKEMLPGFVRMLALSASVFSQAKVADDSDDSEFPSSWRTRLQHIKMLKQRVIDKSGGHHAALAGSLGGINPAQLAGGRRTPVSKDDGHGADQGDDQDGSLAVQLNFGRWTL